MKRDPPTALALGPHLIVAEIDPTRIANVGGLRDDSHMSKSRSPLVSSAVPYVNDRVLEQAKQYLPGDPDEMLDVDRVTAFVEGTKDFPNVRLAVLGTLRAHSMNGAETPTAVLAVLLAAMAILISSISSLSDFGVAIAWVLAVGSFLLGGWFAKLAFAAHARRMTCGVWLAAYEDALC